MTTVVADAVLDQTETVRALWAAGDREGAHRLAVEATHEGLSRFLRHLVRDEEVARDLFQETYLRVFHALGAFRGESSLTTWVLTIGRNLAMSRLRRERMHGMRSVHLGATGDEPAVPELAVRPSEDVLTRSLLAALAALPVSQREAVLLFYGEDASLADIVAITGRPMNTVKSDLMRARTRLRESLRKETRRHDR